MNHEVLVRLALLLAIAACAPAEPPPPDAEAPSPCCELEDDGARACVIDAPDAPPSGTCGVLLCAGDAGIRRINFCIP